MKILPSGVSRVLLLCVGGCTLSACSADDAGGAGEQPIEKTGAEQSLTFDEYLARFVTRPSPGIWLVERDLPMTSEEEVRAYFENYIAPRFGLNGALTVNTTWNGFGFVNDVWSRAEKGNLRYCVSQSYFGANYDMAVITMRHAAAAWENVANVHFEHVSSLDTFCTKFTAGLTFNVGGMPDDDNAATAFFPSWSRDRRELKIDWDDAWNENPRARIGLLIHELGHALGFFHEHVRVPQTGDCALSVQGLAFPVTAYDPLSVMHYFDCPDSANTTDYWFITQRDLEGAQHLYEAPTNVLDVNSNAVYARKASDGQFYKKLPTGTGWALVSAPAVAFVDIGNDLYQRTAGNQIKKYTGSGTTWGPSIATDAWQIFECVGLLCATFGDGTIRRYASGTWTVIGGPGSRFVATASQLFGLSPLQDQVHRWNSGTSWTNIAGAGFSEIFANDGHIFGLTRPRSRVHQTNGFSAWESIGGTGRQWVGAGQFLYRLETDRQGVWRYANGTWDQIEGPTKRLYASNTTLYRTDSANTIYRWNGTTWVLVGTL